MNTKRIITDSSKQDLSKEYDVSTSYICKVMNFKRNSCHAMILRAKILLDHHSKYVQL